MIINASETPYLAFLKTMFLCVKIYSNKKIIL